MNGDDFAARKNAEREAKRIDEVNVALMVKAGKLTYDEGTPEEQQAKAEAVILAEKRRIVTEIEAELDQRIATRDMRGGVVFANGQTRRDLCAEYLDVLEAEFQAEDNYKQLSGAAQAAAAKVEKLTAELTAATAEKSAADTAASNSENKLTAARAARASKREELFTDDAGAGDGDGDDD